MTTCSGGVEGWDGGERVGKGRQEMDDLLRRGFGRGRGMDQLLKWGTKGFLAGEGEGQRTCCSEGVWHAGQPHVQPPGGCDGICSPSCHTPCCCRYGAADLFADDPPEAAAANGTDTAAAGGDDAAAAAAAKDKARMRIVYDDAAIERLLDRSVIAAQAAAEIEEEEGDDEFTKAFKVGERGSG
jgi:hypothetical protein